MLIFKPGKGVDPNMWALGFAPEHPCPSYSRPTPTLVYKELQGPDFALPGLEEPLPSHTLRPAQQNMTLQGAASAEDGLIAP